MIYTAIDPGETVGWAVFDGQHPIEFGTSKYPDEFHNWLQDHKTELFIVEDYKIRPRVNHDWNAGTTLRCIGAILYHAARSGVPVELQQPSIKPVGYGMMGKEYIKGKKGQHIMDALAHGVYYFRKKGYVEAGI